MRIAFRIRHMMATATDVFAKYNQFREVARFEAQNLTWAVEEVETHANAVARGLKSLGLNKGDTLLLRIPPEQQTEIVATQLGAHKLGIKLQRSTAINDNGIVEELQKFSAAGLIFDPSGVGSELDKSLGFSKITNGKKFRVDKFPNLKFLVQTGPYSMNGVYKFKNILNYANDTHSPIKFQQLKADQIPNSTDPIIVTDVYSPYGFKAGLLNALYNNRFVVYAHPDSKNFNVLTSNIQKAYIIGDGISNSELPAHYQRLQARLINHDPQNAENNVTQKEIENPSRRTTKQSEKSSSGSEKSTKSNRSDASTQTKTKK